MVEDRIGRTGDRMADEHHYDPSLYAVTPRLVISLSVPWTSLYPFIRESSLERLSLLAISNFIHPPQLFSSSATQALIASQSIIPPFTRPHIEMQMVVEHRVLFVYLIFFFAFVLSNLFLSLLAFCHDEQAT